MNANDAIQQAAVTLSENITLTLKELLETKHLYQCITTLFNETILKAAVSGVGGFQTQLVETSISKLYGSSWHCWQPSDQSKDPFYHPSLLIQRLAFRVPHAKLFCHECDRVEAFNYVLGQEGFEARTVVSGASPVESETTTQVFAFTFLCQSCKGIPEVLLVRREGNRLSLSGRSPIEHVDTPRDIPKPIARFFSGAIVAHQSGQTLAGVFLIRVLIEQWVQVQAKTKGLKADQALDEYMDGLPKDFKERFPSFRTLYEKLSADIHSAAGSSQLFEEALQQIVEHFEARHLYKLS